MKDSMKMMKMIRVTIEFTTGEVIPMTISLSAWYGGFQAGLEEACNVEHYTTDIIDYEGTR